MDGNVLSDSRACCAAIATCMTPSTSTSAWIAGGSPGLAGRASAPRLANAHRCASRCIPICLPLGQRERDG
eukprot:scaffold265931_cov29-Tisochrysis_lutea.AAC.2